MQTFEVLTPDPTPEFLKMHSVEGFGDQAGLGECELKKSGGGWGGMDFFTTGLVRAFDMLIFIMQPLCVVMIYFRISQWPAVPSSIFQMEKLSPGGKARKWFSQIVGNFPCYHFHFPVVCN